MCVCVLVFFIAVTKYLLSSLRGEGHALVYRLEQLVRLLQGGRTVCALGHLRNRKQIEVRMWGWALKPQVPAP